MVDIETTGGWTSCDRITDYLLVDELGDKLEEHQDKKSTSRVSYADSND